MPWTSEHSKWLVDTGQRLHTADGKEVHIWEFRHEKTNLFSPHGLSTFGITTALIVKLIIGAKGISTLAESILTL